jgi:cyanamide hydratase
MCQDESKLNGWSSMPADAGIIFGDKPFINEPGPISVNEINFPIDDSVVAQTSDYAKAVLHPETFNHSMRVYYYGMYLQSITNSRLR